MDAKIGDYIRETKRRLRAAQDVKAVFAEVRDEIRRDVEAIRAEAAQGRSSIPELDFRSIQSGEVPSATTEAIRRTGTAIIRGVFPRQVAEDWNAELGASIDGNDYYAKATEKAGLDQFFSTLEAGAPQIFGLYWSKPQVMARQAESMAATKRFLNGLWDISGPMGDEFDPDRDYAYADRTRRREPGDTTLGLSPHMDSGSYERWVDPAFQRIYGDIFEGDWRRYDPWKATYRTQTRDSRSGNELNTITFPQPN